MIILTPFFAHLSLSSTLVFKRSGDVVNHILECCWRIAKSKIHDHGFIQAVFRFECSFMLVSIFDAYFVEAPFYVEFGEDKCVSYFCD